MMDVLMYSHKLLSVRAVFTSVCHSVGEAPIISAPSRRGSGLVKPDPPPLASKKYVVLLPSLG